MRIPRQFKKIEVKTGRGHDFKYSAKLHLVSGGMLVLDQLNSYFQQTRWDQFDDNLSEVCTTVLVSLDNSLYLLIESVLAEDSIFPQEN